jgi:hypothetical protein
MAEANYRRPDMKKILVFFVRFIVVSLILYTAWMFIGKFYALIVAYGAMPLVALTGNTLNVERTLKVTEEISLNPIVYVSLVIAVTGVAWKERFRPALIGVLILTAANIITVFFMFLSASTGSEQLWTGTEFLNLTVNFFLPILLWALLMPKGDLMPVNSSSD